MIYPQPTPLAYPHLSHPRMLTPREIAAIGAQAITHRYPKD